MGRERSTSRAGNSLLASGCYEPFQKHCPYSINHVEQPEILRKPEKIEIMYDLFTDELC
jgi:hypothetical protein